MQAARHAAGAGAATRRPGTHRGARGRSPALAGVTRISARLLPSSAALAGARRSASRGRAAAAAAARDALPSPSPSPRCTLTEARFPLRTLPLLVLRAPLVPGGSVCLHLYEPGYLALLEAAMAAPSRLLLIGSTGGGVSGGGGGGESGGSAGAGGGLQLQRAALARVKEVRSLPRGGGVRAVVQAEGRVELAAVALVSGGGGPAAAFHRADAVAGIYDAVERGEEREVRALEAQLRALLRDIQNLAQRFRTAETAAVMAASYWEAAPERLMATVSAAGGGGGADGGGSDAGGSGTTPSPVGRFIDPVALDIADRAARLSFAALQALPHASADERAALAASAAVAVRMRSTVARLRFALGIATEARALLAARCALRSLAPSGE